MRTRMLLCVRLAGLALLAVGCEPIAPIQPQPARPAGPSPKELAQAGQIERLTSENQQLQADLQQARSDHTAAEARARKAEDIARAKAGQSGAAAKLADATIRRLRGDNDKQRSQIATLQTQLAGARKQLGQSTTGAAAMQSELATARSDLKAAQTGQAAQTQRADLAEAKLAQLTKYATDLRQQVIRRDRTITEMQLKATGKATYTPEPPPPFPGKPAPGKPEISTAAFQAKARLTVVSGDTGRIDAGASLGVAKGMRLAVYRGEKFVAYFQVADARTDSAGGFLVQQKLKPQVGDLVMAPPK